MYDARGCQAVAPPPPDHHHTTHATHSEPLPAILLGDFESILPILAAVRRDARVAPHARAARGVLPEESIPAAQRILQVALREQLAILGPSLLQLLTKCGRNARDQSSARQPRSCVRARQAARTSADSFLSSAVTSEDPFVPPPTARPKPLPVAALPVVPGSGASLCLGSSSTTTVYLSGQRRRLLAQMATPCPWAPGLANECALGVRLEARERAARCALARRVDERNTTAVGSDLCGGLALAAPQPNLKLSL